jgi:hypothetical protein
MSTQSTAPQTTPKAKGNNTHMRVKVLLFISEFSFELLFNVLVLIFIYSAGITHGYTGEIGFRLQDLVETIEVLFGGLGTLAAIAAGIALTVFTLWFVHMLSVRDHHRGVLVTLAFAIGIGGFLIYRVIDWGNIGLGFIPSLVLLVITAVEAVFTTFVVPIALNFLLTNLRKSATTP